MLALVIILFSTLGQEIAETIGKKAVAKRRESIYAFGFLAFFWTAIFLLIGVAFGIDFRLSVASIPTLTLRIIIECCLAYAGVLAITKSDRSTFGFLRLLTIPLLLIVDLRLGYNISALQILGIGLLLTSMGFLFWRSKRSKKGAKYALIGAVLAVGTSSLYKYDITNFNSVAGEQITMAFSVMIFFSVLAKIHKTTQPILLIAKPLTGTQSFSFGLGLAIESFAYSFAPPSIIISLKRGFALIWSVIFGHKWFHEHKFAIKIQATSIALIGLVLVALR